MQSKPDDDGGATSRDDLVEGDGDAGVGVLTGGVEGRGFAWNGAAGASIWALVPVRTSGR
jgi:hypothetical protein